MSGKGVWTYIVLPITNGPPSCPRRTPVENVQATLRFLMLPVLISFKVLYRVDALFLFAIPHSLSSSFTGDGAATADESVFSAGRLLLVQPAANTGISVATISVDNLFMLRLLFRTLRLGKTTGVTSKHSCDFRVGVFFDSANRSVKDNSVNSTTVTCYTRQPYRRRRAPHRWPRSQTIIVA